MIADGTVITPENRDEWLAARRETIGASEMAGVMGFSPYTTPIEVWQAKVFGREIVVNGQMLWGSAVEAAILERYETLTSRWVGAHQEFRVHPEIPYITCTLDGLSFYGDAAAELPRVVEAKSACRPNGWGDEGTDDIPGHYVIQAQVQLDITGLEFADVPVTIAGKDVVIYTVRRDERLIGEIRYWAARFHECVQSRTPPTWGNASPADLLVLFPGCAGETKLDANDAGFADLYESYGTQIRVLEELREDVKQNLMRAVGSHQVGILPDGRKVKRYVEDVAEGFYTRQAHTKHYIKILQGRKP